jgi:hypothetical protein
MPKALTIVHVGVFPFGLRPGFQHSVSVKLSNGLIRNGHLVLNFSDRDIARALSLLGNRKLGRRPANNALAAFCERHRPDLLLLGHADAILPETIAAIRSAMPGLRVAQWNVDPLFEPDNIRRIKAKQGVVDMTFVSTSGPFMRALRAGGNNVAFLPNPVDISIERGRCDLMDRLDFDLFYACGDPVHPPRIICGREWNMNDFFNELLPRLPGIRALLAGVLARPKLSGAGYQAALEACAMGLNISRRADYHLYSSDRLAQVVGNGQVALLERTTGYDEIFSDDEMAFFSDLDELTACILRLSGDPVRRRAVATAGRARYQALFNERKVAAWIVDAAVRDADPDARFWETVS